MSGSCRRIAAALLISLGASMAQAQSSQIDVETGGRVSLYVVAVTTPAGDQPGTVLPSVASIGDIGTRDGRFRASNRHRPCWRQGDARLQHRLGRRWPHDFFWRSSARGDGWLEGKCPRTLKCAQLLPGGVVVWATCPRRSFSANVSGRRPGSPLSSAIRTPESKVMTGCGTGPMTDAPSRC